MPFIVRPTITETFVERVNSTPDVVGFQYKAGDHWRHLTFRNFYDECRLVSFGLMSLDLQKGDRVGILSNTRLEWALADMAILGASAITVPVYASSTPEDTAHILAHSEARVVFLEDAEQLEKVLKIRNQLPRLEKLVILGADDLFESSPSKSRSDLVTFEGLKRAGRAEEVKQPDRFRKNLLAAKPDDLITICYTSGTTGTPKGVMLTHDNMMSVIEDCVKSVGDHVAPERELLVAFLPFSHILGKVESMATYAFGWCEAYAENVDKLVDNLGEVKPTLLFSVPRIFEKAYTRISAMVESGSLVKQLLFAWASDVGNRYYSTRWKGETPGVRDFAQYSVANRIIFRKVRERLGGRLKFAICGGAPLSKEIGEFFQIVGIPILEGYGLTETCAPVAVNMPDALKFGTVGRPLPEVSIKTAEDGEILVKSRKVFKGYYKMPDETAETLVDGWLRTGDIGHVDDEGFLHITDRKKDLIITSAGKNVAPQKIENLAKAYPIISQFYVYGDKHNYLTALVALDKDRAVQYANENQILFSAYAELVKNPKIQLLIQRTIDDLNSKLASYETVKKFVILAQEFTVESGELTPSLKMKRNVINRNYQAELESMYAG